MEPGATQSMVAGAPRAEIAAKSSEPSAHSRTAEPHVGNHESQDQQMQLSGCVPVTGNQGITGAGTIGASSPTEAPINQLSQDDVREQFFMYICAQNESSFQLNRRLSCDLVLDFWTPRFEAFLWLLRS
jgi:hypothetical protein